MGKRHALVSRCREAHDVAVRAWRYTHEPPRAGWLNVAVVVSFPVLFFVSFWLDAPLQVVALWWVVALAIMVIVYRRSDRWTLDRLPPPPNRLDRLPPPPDR